MTSSTTTPDPDDEAAVCDRLREALVIGDAVSLEALLAMRPGVIRQFHAYLSNEQDIGIPTDVGRVIVVNTTR